VDVLHEAVPKLGVVGDAAKHLGVDALDDVSHETVGRDSETVSGRYTEAVDRSPEVVDRYPEAVDRYAEGGVADRANRVVTSAESGGDVAPSNYVPSDDQLSAKALRARYAVQGEGQDQVGDGGLGDLSRGGGGGRAAGAYSDDQLTASQLRVRYQKDVLIRPFVIEDYYSLDAGTGQGTDGGSSARETTSWETGMLMIVIV
jgi:hypothetical protein